MMKKIRNTILGGSVALFMWACDDNTGSLGIYPEADNIVHSEDVFNVYTRSVAVDSIEANSTTSYLGHVTDPETGATIQASFASQFYTIENFSLPERNLLFPLDKGQTTRPDHSGDPIHCDSIELRLYYDNFYGEGGNPMKMEVYPLDINNILSEDSTYYSSMNLWQFVAPGTKPIATKMFSPVEYALPDAERLSVTHSPNVHISLPREYGDHIMNSYYQHPEYFRNSYSFIRNVCPGFYFRIKSGSGTMLGITTGVLNIYYKYFDTQSADSVYLGMSRFAATPEVIQSTQIQNDDLHDLVNDPTCTYLKTPAGICTELSLPVDEIYKQHPADSVNKAQLTLTRYNKDQDKVALGTPQTLLLVRKQDMGSFFQNHRVKDDQTSFTTKFDPAYNSYTFNNLCRLISYCQHEKLKGMQEEGLTESQWEARHPDWNKAMLIPVETSENTSGYQVSCTHDMGLNSVRLVGGPNNPIQMQVIYSRFQK